MPIPTPASTPARCAHEPRPGTVVCLHCRHEARLAADAARNRLLAKVGGGVLLVGLVIGGAVLGVRALTVERPAVAITPPSPGTPPAQSAPAPAPPAEPELLPPAAFTAAAPGVPLVTLAADVPSAAPSTIIAPVVPSSAPARGAVIAEGRTALGGGLVAERTGDVVVVHFDTPTTRTRRHDKFERIVRETLPAVYGALAESALAAVPAGTLSRGADLLTELPTRGLHLRTPDGATLALWPTTRPGRDGPLVVSYRVTVVR